MADDQEAPRTIAFEFVKGADFRVLRVDGAWGGLTPRGLIFAAFFAERPSIPTRIEHGIDETGNLGPELRENRVDRQAVIRDVDIGITMSLSTARSFHSWLGSQIEALTAATKTGETISSPEVTNDLDGDDH